MVDQPKAVATVVKHVRWWSNQIIPGMTRLYIEDIFK